MNFTHAEIEIIEQAKRSVKLAKIRIGILCFIVLLLAVRTLTGGMDYATFAYAATAIAVAALLIKSGGHNPTYEHLLRLLQSKSETADMSTSNDQNAKSL